MRLRSRDSRFKVMPEVAAPRPHSLRIAAVSFWLLIALLSLLLLYHLGRGWLFVRIEGIVVLPGYGVHSDRAVVLRALKVQEGDQVAAGQILAEVAPLVRDADRELVSIRRRIQLVGRARRLVQANDWQRLRQNPELLALLPESYIRGQSLAAANASKLFELAPIRPETSWWREAALAHLARERQRLEETVRHRLLSEPAALTAPHDGKVIQIFKRPGEEVRSGELILRVRTGGCEIHVPVPWSQLAILAKRRRVRLISPDGNRWTADVVRWLATGAPYRDRLELKRFFSGGEKSWRFVLRPLEADFPCLELNRGVVEVEFPRWPLSVTGDDWL